MKLYLSMLQRLLDIPALTPVELRNHLDEAGLEVKDIESLDGGDVLFTIETLANRGDHVCAWGVARELSARMMMGVRVPAVAAQLPERGVTLPIRKLTDACSRYAALEMAADIATTPRSEVYVGGAVKGERHPLVDVSNYLLLEMGQPTHVFDRDKVEGEIAVVLSDTEQTVITLTGAELKVPAGSILIRDRVKTIAVAGVIGCQNSMVTTTTKKVVVESAAFDPILIRKTARAMGLSTDASHLFERGSDPEQVVFALRRFVYLAQGAFGVVKDASSAHPLGYTLLDGQPLERRKIRLRFAAVRKQMNLPRLPEIEMTARLKCLGYTVDGTPTDKEVSLVVPSWRLWDVAHEQDVVEDVVRSLGLSRIKIEVPSIRPEVPTKDPKELFLGAVRPALLGSGFFEVITKGFYTLDDIEPLVQLQSGFADQHLRIKNAIDRGNSLLKATNLLHIADVLERNMRVGVTSAKVFELARVFGRTTVDTSPFAFEHDVLSLGFSGRWYTEEWGKTEALDRRILLFKGVLVALGRALNAPVALVASKHPWLHPGYQAELKVGTTKVGCFGLLHPTIKAERKYRFDHIVAEFNAHQLIDARREFTPLVVSDLPSIKRDITLGVGKRDWSQQVISCINGMKLEHVTDIACVDSFEKEGEDFRRLTYRLTFQHQERSLEHAEVDGWMEGILAGIKSKLGFELAPA